MERLEWGRSGFIESPGGVEQVMSEADKAQNATMIFLSYTLL